jgi:hypothetical protein
MATTTRVERSLASPSTTNNATFPNPEPNAGARIAGARLNRNRPGPAGAPTDQG